MRDNKLEVFFFAAVRVGIGIDSTKIELIENRIESI